MPTAVALSPEQKNAQDAILDFVNGAEVARYSQAGVVTPDGHVGHTVQATTPGRRVDADLVEEAWRARGRHG